MDCQYSAGESDNDPFTASRARKTLVQSCTNGWQNQEKSIPAATLVPGHSDMWYDKYLDELDDAYDTCLPVLKAPKFRRMVVTIVGAALFTWLLRTWFLWPFVEEERAAWDTFRTYNPDAQTPLFGTNTRPRLGLIQTKDLDSSLLPGGSKATKARRLIFIGDIHGCKEELVRLLERAKYNEETDHIVSLGDIVTKGPDPLGVIDLLREKKASVVRGNQDDRVILLAEQHRRHLLDEDVQELMSRSKRKHDLRTPEDIARALSNEQLKWLQSFPLILRIGDFKHIGEVVGMLGLVPGLPLASRDPVAIMNMRSIDLKTHVPSKQHHHKHKGSKPWFKIWGKYQRLLPAMNQWSKGSKHGLVTTQMTVIYGHDARMGLQISRFSKGIDTNCARAGRLTALILDEHGKEVIVQISCHKDYTSTISEEEYTT